MEKIKPRRHAFGCLALFFEGKAVLCPSFSKKASQFLVIGPFAYFQERKESYRKKSAWKRKVTSMCLIPCSADCKYQSDGYCQLEHPTTVNSVQEHAAPITSSEIPASAKTCLKRLPNIAHRNKFHPGKG